MAFIPLKSSMLSGVSWTPKSSQMQDNDLGTMEIQFKSGKTYTFENVPQDVYQGLVEAPSPGGYYNEVIKGQY